MTKRRSTGTTSTHHGASRDRNAKLRHGLAGASRTRLDGATTLSPRSARMRMLHALLAVVPGLGAACDWAELHKPTPPSTEAIRAEFDAPTGRLEGLTAEEVTPFLLEAVDQVQDFCGFSAFDPIDCPPNEDCLRCPFERHVGDMLARVAEALRGEDDEVVSLPGIAGALTLQSVCRGWDMPSPDPAHGFVEASLGFSGEGLDPVIWGHAHDCEERSGRSDRAQRYDGDFIFTYEPAERVPYDQLHQLPFVLLYEGTIYDRALGIEFPLRAATRRRLDGMGPREFLVRTLLGSFVAELGMGDVVVRGGQQSFRCDIKAATCAEL